MQKNNDFWVLALSGGGYRGLFTATVLEELEKRLGGPIARHFDLITGTSIGGILGLGLASEIRATELRVGRDSGNFRQKLG